jgi:replication factor C subunit 3/5
VASSYHIEMNPSDFGFHDRVVVSEVIKEIAQSRSLDTKRTFKVVVNNQVDNLTQVAQHALRRTMETYVNNCRLILIGHSSSKVIEPVRSRCLGVRVPAPTLPDIEKILLAIARKENLTLPPSLAAAIATQSERNLRRAVLMFEATRVKQYPFAVDQQPEHPAWEDYVSQIAREMTEEQSPRRLAQIRQRLYDLLVRSIPADVIFKTLVAELFTKIDDDAKIETAHWAGRRGERVAVVG